LVNCKKNICQLGYAFWLITPLDRCPSRWMSVHWSGEAHNCPCPGEFNDIIHYLLTVSLSKSLFFYQDYENDSLGWPPSDFVKSIANRRGTLERHCLLRDATYEPSEGVHRLGHVCKYEPPRIFTGGILVNTLHENRPMLLV
jgi:hypothetical protein